MSLQQQQERAIKDYGFVKKRSSKTILLLLQAKSLLCHWLLSHKMAQLVCAFMIEWRLFHHFKTF